MQVELAGVQRPAQRGQQAEPVGGVAVARRVVHLDAGVLLLGQVHRDVGAAHELLDVGAVLGVQRDADARLELEQHLLELERLDERVADPAGDVRRRRGRSPMLRQDDGELVAAQPGHQVLAGRSTPWIRCATSSSSRSPTWWPRVSLTSLNRSRSSSATENRGDVAGARTASSSRCSRYLRLGRPVSGSCSALCCSTSDIRAVLCTANIGMSSSGTYHGLAIAASTTSGDSASTAAVVTT